jgi:hypothetical protein
MDELELHDMIYASLVRHRTVETGEDMIFVHELTLEALEGILPYIRELEEAISHNQATIKRLREQAV